MVLERQATTALRTSSGRRPRAAGPSARRSSGAPRAMDARLAAPASTASRAVPLPVAAPAAHRPRRPDRHRAAPRSTTGSPGRDPGCAPATPPRRPLPQLDRDVGEHRVLELPEERPHLLRHLGRAADVGVGAAPELGGLGHEVPVRRRADADREQAAPPETLADVAKSWSSLPTQAVGHEDDLADDAGPPRRPRAPPGARAASRCRPSPGAPDPAPRGSTSVRPAGTARREEPLGPGVELDHVEAVLGRQRVDRLASAGAPARSRRPPSSRRCRRRTSPRAAAGAPAALAGGRQEHHERIALRRRALGEDGARPARARLGRPGELEVAVRRHGAVAQGDRGAAVRPSAW